MTAFLHESSSAAASALAVLQRAILEISYEVMGPAVLCVLACVYAVEALTALEWIS
jgi:hypothetical protein